MFRKRINLDRPIEIKGKKLKVLVTNKLTEIQDVMNEYDARISKLGNREGTSESEFKRKLIREQLEFKVQKDWLKSLLEIIVDSNIYCLTIGEARTFNILK